MDVSGRTAFVTGTGQGIGLGLARALAEAGCDVIGCDLSEDRQADARAAVEGADRRYEALVADLSDTGAARRVTREAAERGFDVLINNAGIAPSGPYAEVPFETWAKTVEIDLLACMATTHEAVPHLLGRPRGLIVQLSSIAGVAAAPGMAAYNAAKFGVTGFTRALEMELAKTNVGVLLVHPTMVKTRMTEGVEGSSAVPVIEPGAVVSAVMDAIRQDRRTVFVPRRMGMLTSALPALFPGVARRMSLRDPSTASWMRARKGLPDG